MTRFDLKSRVKATRRRSITLPAILTTQAQASGLAAIYLRVVDHWSAARERIVAAYSKTLSELQTDSADDIRASLDSVDEEVRRLVLSLTPDLRRWALGIERVHRGKWVNALLSAAAVELETILSVGDVEETLDSVIEWNVSLIRDVSAEARRRISNSVFAGLQQRQRADDVAREIRAATGMARDRARRIATDQTIKLGERLNRARQEQAGITHFKWRHSAKKHPRIWHEARDGQVYPWSGSGIPADDMPGVPPFCGCTAQGVVTFDEPPTDS